MIPAVPYLQAIGLEKDELVQALGLSFSVSTLALAVSLGYSGELLQPALVGVSVLALLPALLGMAGGQWLRRRISAERFKRWFFIGLLLLGADLALRGMF
ncbi:Sulfite exporter TauE/SafE [compost metagenome]